MNYQVHSFRNALTIFQNDAEFSTLWNEVQLALESITEKDLIRAFQKNARGNKKSLSESINKLIDERLVDLGWSRQSAIFQQVPYIPTKGEHWWTLDFAKGTIAIEVAFNHQEAIAWNLIKPVLSSELNHVTKAIQTRAGIVITTTNALKKIGNFDGSCGTYEKFLTYLEPFQNILTTPMVIIGLDAPLTFAINPKTKEVEYTLFHSTTDTSDGSSSGNES